MYRGFICGSADKVLMVCLTGALTNIREDLNIFLLQDTRNIIIAALMKL
jgi:hypothetical protein